MTSHQQLLPALVAAALAALVAGGCGGDGGDRRMHTDTEPPECSGRDSSPTPAEIDGMQAIRHCGPAIATITIGKHKATVIAGSCVLRAGSIVVNVGTNIDDISAPAGRRNRHAYVGLAMGSAAPAPAGSPPVTGDGTFQGRLAFTATADGVVAVARTGKLVLSGAGDKGQLTARAAGNGDAIEAHFSCS